MRALAFTMFDSAFGVRLLEVGQILTASDGVLF